MAAEVKREGLEARRRKLRERFRRAEEGWLDGLVPKDRFRGIQSELIAERHSIDEEILDLERHGSNRLEPMARFIKASKMAKKVASGGTEEEKLDFFKKIGSNPQLVTRQLVCEPRGAWKPIEKSTLLAPVPADTNASAGNVAENTFAFSESGGGGIRTHGDPKATPVFKTGPFDHSGTPPGAVFAGCSIAAAILRAVRGGVNLSPAAEFIQLNRPRGKVTFCLNPPCA